MCLSAVTRAVEEKSATIGRFRMGVLVLLGRAGSTQQSRSAVLEGGGWGTNEQLQSMNIVPWRP